MTIINTRRALVATVLSAVAGLLGACGAPSVGASDSDTYPTRTIDVIVPYQAGGGSDIIARALVDEINGESDLGQQLQVVNKGGGAGLVGMTEMVEAKPDGYTISISPVGPVSLHPAMTDVPYDPMADISYISGITSGGPLIAVSADSPYETIDDLIEDAKARPGQISMGGGPPAYDIPRAMFEDEADVTFSHVAYDGDAATTTAILGDNLDATFTQNAAALPQVEAGKMRVLATVGGERSPFLTDVPTLKESGFDVVSESSYGVYAPSDIPSDVIETLAPVFESALNSEHLQEQAEATGIVLQYRDGEAQKTLMQEQLDAVKELKASGLI